MGTYDDTSKFGLQSAKSKQDFRGALDSKNGGTKESATRPVVRIISYRCRILDEDNLAGGCKPLLDSLRYAELIHGDSPKEIVFQASQIRVAHRKDEKTVLEIEYGD